MKIFVTLSMLCAVVILACTPAMARRGNPVNAATNTSPKSQYYIIDSDDNDPRAPVYNFVDTLYDAAHWHRVTGFTSLDDGYGQPAIGTTDSINFIYMNNQLRIPPRYITTNGLMKMALDTFYNDITNVTDPNNESLPTFGNPNLEAVVCPLWGDMEFRSTGDSSKVFWRKTTDSVYVTYYNLFLKGTAGAVRATFQVAFSNTDSSITFNYRSLDGSFNGTPAATVFQNETTIGVQNAQNTYGTMYFDRGTYYAISSGSQLYAQPFHTSLAVKFLRVIPNFVRIRSINTPPFDGDELSNNSFTPQYTVENMTNNWLFIVGKTTVINLATGLQVYSSTDSLEFLSHSTMTTGANPVTQITARTLNAFPCGKYRMTVTISCPSIGTDGWTQDNIMTRDFAFVPKLTAPFYDNFISLNYCNWHSYGATWVDGSNFFDSPPPSSTGAILLNRRDANGDPYLTTTGSDTIVSSAMDLSKLTGIWLSLSYQRGLASDTMKAGVKARVLVGPEPVDKDPISQATLQGDSLIIEGLVSTAPTNNDTAASHWAAITTLYGGLDITTQKYRVALDPKFYHDHFRLRFRLMAKDDHVKYGFPLEDDDNWLIDNVQISAPTNGKTDLEPLNISLGAGNYTHVPRKPAGNPMLITPIVTIGNNGLQTNAGVFNVHVLIKDALNRAVYDAVSPIVQPAAHSSTNVAMPIWNIQGSQGGVFTCKVNLAQDWNDYYKPNDTATFLRTLYIDNEYALDDGVPDTSGSMAVADNSFYYDFVPLSDDSLRAIDFYHLGSSGNTIWSINIIDTSIAPPRSNIVRTLSFSYNVLTPGFNRGTFTPFFVHAGQNYRLQFTMNQGSGLGGDGSKGLEWETQKGSANPVIATIYAALHQDVLQSFRTSSNVDYFTAQKNAASGGPILPMFRLIFQGQTNYLPVEIASFTGKRLDDGPVNLAFRTAKESDVDHFEIDRESPSGLINAGNIAATNDRLGSSYALLDENAPHSGITYHLVEVDLDGSHRLAATTAVGAFGSPDVFDVHVYPNPATETIHAMISGNADDISLALYDALGKVVAAKDHVSSGNTDLDTGNLPAGSYWLVARAGETTARTKVAITK